MFRLRLGLIFFLLDFCIYGQGPLPSRQQLNWHQQEFYLFMHFGPNTFTDKEWGHGDEPSEIFNPTSLDCRQWARIAKQSGARGIIITAKHHDGFCLWPSKFSNHTVRESKWKNGKGDVLKELSQACKEYGLKFGVYLSPWDRNHPDYGTDKYNDVFINMMKEIFSNYGPVWELWWDGANGEGPNGKVQVYDWDRFKKTVRKYSPNTVVFSDVGPDIRWVGNEQGIAGETNWNMIDTAGFTPGAGAPPVDTLKYGQAGGRAWIPAECDVSIRPGWFYHEKENDKVKTPEQLFDIYLKSVGRGANLLLNVPPDERGLIHENDSAALAGFMKLRENNFSYNLLRRARTYWEVSEEKLIADSVVYKITDAEGGIYGINENSFFVSFKQSEKLNCIVFREAIHLGQSIKKFRLDLFRKDSLVKTIHGTTIGRKRILTFPSINVTSFRMTTETPTGSDVITGVGAFLIEERLIGN